MSYTLTTDFETIKYAKRCAITCTPFILHLNRTNVLFWGLYITHLEDFIKDLYIYMRINRAEQQSITRIANTFNLNVYYGNTSFRIGNDLFIKRSTKQREWQMFGHELGHYLRHCGNQYAMYYLFRELQEYQANQFAYHFCVPTFMLDDLETLTASDIADTFTVEYEFALNRLEMYERKVIDAGIYY